METKNLNLTPANEVELRLICLNMAMEIVQNGNIDKTPGVIKSAEDLLDFATKGGSLPVETTSSIISALAPLIAQFGTALSESKTGCCGGCHTEQVPTPNPAPEAQSQAESVSVKSTKK